MFAQDTTALRSISKANNLAQIALIERALALDPDYVWALRENARKRANRVNQRMVTRPCADLAIATKAVDRALAVEAQRCHDAARKGESCCARRETWTRRQRCYAGLIER